MGIRIDGNNDLIKAVDDTLTIEGISVNTSGMVTATGGIKVGTAATIHSTGQLNIGVAHTLFANGNATHSGIVTASSFTGSGANLTSLPAANLTGTLPAIDGSNLTGIDADKIQEGNSFAEVLDTGTNGIFRFLPENSEVFRITHEAKVGINTNNPSHNLDISADGVAFPSAAGSTILRLRNSAGSATLSIDANASSGSVIQFGDTAAASVGTIQYSHATNHLQFNTNGDGEKMRITSGGVVQIGGETANSADIDTSNSKLTIKQSANSAEDGIYIERSGERRGHYIYVGGGLSQSDALCITTNQLGTDTDLLAIDRGGDVIIGAGNVGIASNAPGCALDVVGDTHLGSKKFVFNGTSGHFGIYDSSTDTTPDNEIQVVTSAPQIRLEENSSGASKRLDLFVTSGGQPTIAANQSSQSIAFQTTGSERFRITNDGVTFNGDTAAANGLDDYEEGSWTPGFYPMSSAMTLSYSLQTGSYVKIGRVCYWAFRVRLSGLSGQMGQNMGFGGFPFNVDNSQPQFSANIYGSGYNGEIPDGIFYQGSVNRGDLYYPTNSNGATRAVLQASDCNPTDSYTAATGFFFVA